MTRAAGATSGGLEPGRLVADGLLFPEGPRWHEEAVWFSDIHGHRVHRVVPGGPLETVVELADRPSGLGFLPDGTLLVVSELDLRILAVDPDTGAVQVHADLTAHDGDFLNDMVVDRQGRAFVGNRRHAAYGDGLEVQGRPGREDIVLVEPDGSSRVVAQGLISPNGMVVTPDESTLVVAETRAHRLTAFDLLPDGSLGRTRPYAATGERYPDGIAMDADGAVWLGSPVTHEFVRLAEGGQVLDVITTGSAWAVAPALGGRERTTLFLATAENSLANLDRLGHDRDLDATSASRGALWARGGAVAGAGWP